MRGLVERTPVPVDVEVCAGPLPAPVEAAAYFVIAEALTNVAKHAQAGAARVTARRTRGVLLVEVSDDGVGGADPDGNGLAGLRDRVFALRGEFEVTPVRSGGTRIAAAIPAPALNRGRLMLGLTWPHSLRRHGSRVLRGRRDECAALDRVLDELRHGRSGVLVIRGEPGVGKSALLEYVSDAVSDFRVARAVGVDSEMELAFAGLHQLCGPLLDRLDRLPPPQREALGTAFGLSTGHGHDRFLLGLAVLTLLSEVAAERPLVALIDDAQWLDRASLATLAFVARRLYAESVALILATRELSDELSGLPELVVEGLQERDARALLSTVMAGPLDEHVRERLLAETRGNPLALLELPRGLTAPELAGGFALPAAPLSGRIEASFRQRFEQLPADTRRLVLAAAAEPVGDAALLWRACARLGIGAEAAAPAEAAGLFRLDGRVTFFHPLVRSAVYRGAAPDERRAVHRALAEATDPEQDPDRRAWHRAEAAMGADEDVAAELERSAGRAQARGGLAAAAAFLERSTAMTADQARRAERALAAAQAKYEAGAPDAARRLLEIVELGPLDDLQRARVERLRARLAFAERRGADAPPLLLQAARRLEPLDAALARETYAEALGAALTTGQRESMEAASQALRAAPPPARAAELVLTGQALRLIDGPAAGVPVLRRALHAFRSEPLSGEDELRGLGYACSVALNLWDDESWQVLSARHVTLAREAGALTILPQALEMHAASLVLRRRPRRRADAGRRGGCHRRSGRQRAAHRCGAHARRLARRRDRCARAHRDGDR